MKKLFSLFVSGFLVTSVFAGMTVTGEKDDPITDSFEGRYRILEGLHTKGTEFTKYEYGGKLYMVITHLNADKFLITFSGVGTLTVNNKTHNMNCDNPTLYTITLSNTKEFSRNIIEQGTCKETEPSNSLEVSWKKNDDILTVTKYSDSCVVKPCRSGSEQTYTITYQKVN